MTPLVSVIIPTYNSAQYLESTIDSVLSQSYQNFEIILIDDQSNDSTPELLKTWSQRSNIRVYSQLHAGPGVARNLGIKKAQGEYICFLDADDLLQKDSLLKRVKVLEETPSAHLVFNNYFRCKNPGQLPPPFLTEQNFLLKFNKAIEREHNSVFVMNDKFIDCAIEYFPYILTSTVMIRRSTVNKTGLFESWRGSEDVDYWFRTLPHGRIAYIDEPLTHWRTFLSTITKRTDSTFYRDTLKCYLRLKNQTKDKPHLKKLLNRKLSYYAFAGGYEALNQENLTLARNYFKKAVQFQRHSPKLWFYTGLSFLPKPLFHSLRHIKHALL